MVQVLSQASSELRFIEIHQSVEELLGGPVARSSVKNALAKASRAETRASNVPPAGATG